MRRMVGVRFRPGGKIYNFEAGDLPVKLGGMVVVETEQGLGLGQVVTPVIEILAEGKRPLKKIQRLATEDDLWQHEKNVAREKFAFDFCLERIKARDMAMKLVGTEVLFDGSKIIFYYTADGRVDFRALVKDLVGKFRTRIEMRQIGVRHEAKMIGGLGCCGREFCCSSFLNEFAPVSVKMAKEQNLSLNPAKISGVCGRLMCCLTFEYEVYLEKKRGLPKLGKRCMTCHGEGKIIRQNILERVSTVMLPDGKEVDVYHEEILEEPDDMEILEEEEIEEIEAEELQQLEDLDNRTAGLNGERKS